MPRLDVEFYLRSTADACDDGPSLWCCHDDGAGQQRLTYDEKSIVLTQKKAGELWSTRTKLDDVH
jgi:hypothetical protein